MRMRSLLSFADIPAESYANRFMENFTRFPIEHLVLVASGQEIARVLRLYGLLAISRSLGKTEGDVRMAVVDVETTTFCGWSDGAFHGQEL